MVVRPVAEPFQFTTEPLTKPVPFTVRVNAVPPAVAEVGFRPVIAGAGLLTVKADPLDVPPPGVEFTTVTLGVPAVAIFEAGTATVNCAPLT